MPYCDSLPTPTLDYHGPEDVQTPGDSLLGRCLDSKFLIRELIGEGSCGHVYLADQVALNRSVAIKVLRPMQDADSALPRRFHGEAFAASKLHHPNVIAIYDYGQTPDGLFYIAMEYLRGRTLRRLLQEEFPLPPSRAIDLLLQVLNGLEEAHAAGVVHADLKSDNIVVLRLRDGGELVKLVDFGIARILRNDSPETARKTTHSGPWRVSGTPGYMAPEVVAGEEPRMPADIYAVGAVLYELLTGELPFSGGSIDEILARHLDADIIPPSVRCPELHIPRVLEQVAMRALARDPGQRFPDVASFREALKAARQDTARAACPACGASHGARTRFCSECGARLDDEPRSATGRSQQAVERERTRGQQVFDQGDTSTGVEIMRHAVGMAIRLGDTALMLDCYHSLASLLARLGAYDTAIREIEEAIDLVTAGGQAAASHCPEGLWQALLKLAELYHQNGDIEHALAMCAQALFHARTASPTRGLAQAKALMRHLYAESRRPSSDASIIELAGARSAG